MGKLFDTALQEHNHQISVKCNIDKHEHAKLNVSFTIPNPENIAVLIGIGLQEGMPLSEIRAAFGDETKPVN